MPEPGIVQIYTGNSKGKTTAAIGQTIRAIGHGWRAAFIQFMKGSSYYGELTTLTKLAPAVEVWQYGRICSHNALIKQGESDCLACGQCFVEKGKATDFDHFYSKKAVERSLNIVGGGEFQLVVLDEILNAVYFELVTEATVHEIIDKKPASVELILTGRNLTDSIAERAQLITEMKQVRHPYEVGIPARRGIEY
ncbi:MAG: cob(I)yrinic acid a,c-diamide adenosyltransferase [Firmicutes bacterium]|nr:cob(I)yrinic acid a,c-diamide adenosyltransferase [Bacillota bacterium]